MSARDIALINKVMANFLNKTMLETDDGKLSTVSLNCGLLLTGRSVSGSCLVLMNYCLSSVIYYGYTRSA